MPSKLTLTILSDTVSKFARFFETQCTTLYRSSCDKNTFCGTRYLSHSCSLHGTVLLSRR